MTNPETSLITFADGVNARLVTLEQTCAYAGWLEGIANTRMNTGMIERASEGIDLVQPPSVELLEAEVPASWGRAEVLPSVQITARFSSDQTQKPDGPRSDLSMVWWQDGFIKHLDEELNTITNTVSW